MTILEQVRKAIEEGHPTETQNLVEEALRQHVPPEKIVEDAMTPAMWTVGEQYRLQNLDVVHILSSANSVKKGFELLEAKAENFNQKNIGTVILGTVEGDLHDIGKNLVALMFRSAGFKVIDLGIDNSEKKFLQAVKENPDVSIVCISSLLSTAIPEMEHIVKALRRNSSKYHYKIMVGGGALNAQLADKIGADAYTADCVEAVEVAKTFIL